MHIFTLENLAHNNTLTHVWKHHAGVFITATRNVQPRFFFFLLHILPMAHLGWANDHAIPLSQRHVVIIHEAPAHCAVSTSLLTFLQFLQQPKAAGNDDA